MRPALVPMPAPRPTLSARIAHLEAELRTLRRRQLDELLYAIARVIGCDVVFSARELWGHRVVSGALRAVLADTHITSPRTLGKRLQRLQLRPAGGVVLERVGEDQAGALWALRVSAHSHGDAGATPAGGA